MTLATRTENETREERLTRLRDALTPRQALFAEEYARNGGNGADAIRAAGYATEKLNAVYQQVGQNLSLPHVVAYLNEITGPARQERIVDAVELAEKLSQIVRGEMIAPIVTKDGVVDTTPTHSDRIKAAETLAKVRGYLAPVKFDVTIEIKDAGLSWVGAVLSILQAKFDLSDEEIEAVLPELPNLKIGNRQEIKIIDME